MIRTRTDQPGDALPAQRRAAIERVARELNENLAALQGILRQFLEQTEQKLVAIRAADPVRMHRCTTRETDLLEQISHVDQQRTAILARLAQHVPAASAPNASLATLARQFPEPFSSVLHARSEGLRQIARTLQEKNTLVARVAQNLQSHIRAVFTDLAKINQESNVYGPKGQHQARNVRCWLDAVG